MSALAAFTLYASLNAGDYYSTNQGLSAGGREVNPVVQTMGLAPTKVLTTLALTAGDRSIKSKKGRLIYRVIVIGGYGFVIAHNLRVNRR